jgi:hypothetical protein
MSWLSFKKRGLSAEEVCEIGNWKYFDAFYMDSVWRLPAPVHLAGTVAVLADEYAYNNFSHWVFDVLPKIDVLKKAKKWIVASVPVVPTKHINPYHLHDFAPQQLPDLFVDDQWEYYQYLGQPTELAEIYVFRNLA